MDFTCVFDSKGVQLFIFAIIEAPSRRLVLINSTANPTKEWLIQQFRSCCISGHVFPDAMMHDRDGVYGQWLADLLKEFDCISAKTPPRSPWANPFIERFWGSLKREMLDRVNIVNNDHARELSLEYLKYYNQDRPHQGINGRIPGQSSPGNQKVSNSDVFKVKKIRKISGLVTQFALAS